jgi:hypothetical protein
MRACGLGGEVKHALLVPLAAHQRVRARPSEVELGDSHPEHLADPGARGVEEHHQRQVAPPHARRLVGLRHQGTDGVARQALDVALGRPPLRHARGLPLEVRERDVVARGVGQEDAKRRQPDVTGLGAAAARVRQPRQPRLDPRLGEVVRRERGRRDPEAVEPSHVERHRGSVAVERVRARREVRRGVGAEEVVDVARDRGALRGGGHHSTSGTTSSNPGSDTPCRSPASDGTSE